MVNIIITVSTFQNMQNMHCLEMTRSLTLFNEEVFSALKGSALLLLKIHWEFRIHSENESNAKFKV